jgi:pimeloyl-ACP methyl ester carboxylesterase
VVAGSGSPVFLLHGWPQTWYEWREVIPILARHHTVIAPDIRGLGASSRAEAGYDGNTLGDDIAGLAHALGYDEIAIVGHDWGGVPAFTCAAQHRTLVTRLAVVDNVMPGTGIFEPFMTPTPGDELPGGIWLWPFAFHFVPDIPEMLIAGRERRYISWFFEKFAYDPSVFASEDIEIYARALETAGGLRTGLSYYRAFFQTAAQVKAHAQNPLTIPVLAVGGEIACGDLTLQAMQRLATHVEGGSIPRCGHWVAEERPDYLANLLLDFLDGPARIDIEPTDIQDLGIEGSA